MGLDINDTFSDRPTAWVKMPGADGVEFELAYSESKEPRDFFTRGMSKLRRKSHNGQVDAAKQQDLTLEMLIKYVVKGWKGFTNKGEEYPYSLANCRTLLTNSAPLRDFVAVSAQDIENFGGKLTSDDDAPDGEAEGGASAPEVLKSGAEMAT